MLLITLILVCPCMGAAVVGEKCDGIRGTFEYFPVEGRTLSGSVYRRFRPVSSATCGQRCHFSPECASFNYCPRSRRCDLNNSTRASRELIQDEFCIYYDANKTTAFYSYIPGPGPTVMPHVVTTPVSCSYVTTPMTPYEYTYVLPHVNLGTNFRVNFSLRAPRNGNIALSSLPNDSGVFYEIIIGGYTNTKSAIRTCKACDAGQLQITTNGILSDAEDRLFWIEYNDGNVQVGTGGNSPSPMMSKNWYGGQRPSTVYVGVSTWQDASGHWFFLDFCE
ncbi:uncharacterized protein LOC119730848 [Patiria miniata]|uniref:Apple domain-containing protein n=1 Tax=Patiria miniata TaxID=46514 RepID=A0A914A8U3_PATMI|nr:uncharacterized protein LOC119730848 [Patiria miniata]